LQQHMIEFMSFMRTTMHDLMRNQNLLKIDTQNQNYLDAFEKLKAMIIKANQFYNYPILKNSSLPQMLVT